MTTAISKEHVAYATPGMPVKVSRSRGKFAKGKLGFHSEIEFQLIRSGKGEYFVDGRNYPLRKGSLLIIRPETLHSAVANLDAIVDKTMLVFDASAVACNSMKTDFVMATPPLLQLDDDELAQMDTLLWQVNMELKRQGAFWRELVKTRITEWIYMVARLSQRPVPPKEEPPVLRQLLDYVEENFKRPSNVSSIAKAFGYSNTHLSRLCRAHTGLGLKHFILQRRIVEAQCLLSAEPQLNGSAIASMVGFSDFGLFNRSFKRHVGATPSEYRKSCHLHGR